MTATAHHPCTGCPARSPRMHTTLDQLTEVPLWSMSGPETAETYQQLARLEARISRAQDPHLARLDQAQVGDRRGAKSTAHWVAHTTRTTRTAAHRQLRLAHGLDTHEATRQALAAGGLHVEQAEAILRAIDDLPDDLDPDLVARPRRI